jgi:hypothetical protein
MHRYAHYTPMTDTVELAACHRGAPMTDVPTAQMWLMDLKPAPAPAVPARPRRRLRAAARATYATLIAVGAATLAGCSVAGPNELIDTVIRALG